METTAATAPTTARATAALAATRSVLMFLDAQRTALLTYEATVLVHSIAVQNLTDYPEAATITFSSHHPTSVTVEEILRADGAVHREATDEVAYEITEALQETALLELARAGRHGVFAAHGIQAVASGVDEVVTGTIDLAAAASSFPVTPAGLPMG